MCVVVVWCVSVRLVCRVCLSCVGVLCDCLRCCVVGLLWCAGC